MKLMKRVMRRRKSAFDPDAFVREMTAKFVESDSDAQLTPDQAYNMLKDARMQLNSKNPPAGRIAVENPEFNRLLDNAQAKRGKFPEVYEYYAKREAGDQDWVNKPRSIGCPVSEELTVLTMTGTRNSGLTGRRRKVSQVSCSQRKLKRSSYSRLCIGRRSGSRNTTPRSPHAT